MQKPTFFFEYDFLNSLPPRQSPAPLTPGKPLLEQLAAAAGCAVLSDLRFLDRAHRYALAQLLKPLAARESDLFEWNDALNYLTDAAPEQTASAAKAQLICLLSELPSHNK